VLLLEPPAGAPPPAELWATAQLPQHNTTASNISFRDDMFSASKRFELFELRFPADLGSGPLRS
jgi:hypothetical protein